MKKKDYYNKFVIVGVICMVLLLLFIIALGLGIHYYGEYKYYKSKADYLENQPRELQEGRFEKMGEPTIFKQEIDEEGYFYYEPLGQYCRETPCDCHKWGCALYCMECKEENLPIG